MLARAQLHLHNITTDGPLHVDAERDSVTLWNVVISLHDDPATGATMIYPPNIKENDVMSIKPRDVRAKRSNVTCEMESEVRGQVVSGPRSGMTNVTIS